MCNCRSLCALSDAIYRKINAEIMLISTSNHLLKGILTLCSILFTSILVYPKYVYWSSLLNCN